MEPNTPPQQQQSLARIRSAKTAPLDLLVYQQMDPAGASFIGKRSKRMGEY